MKDIILKYTKDIDYFIVYLLPYLEKVLIQQNIIISIHTYDMLCEILNIMFEKNIIVHRIQPYTTLQILELDEYLNKYYPITHITYAPRPLMANKLKHLKSLNYVCIYPKLRIGEKINNIDRKTLGGLIENTELKTLEKYIIGDPVDKLNTNLGIDVNNFVDSLDYLRYCKLFICSESNWHYISLLCNCRNVIVFNEEPSKRDMLRYNPYMNNVVIVEKILDNHTYDIINKILKK